MLGQTHAAENVIVALTGRAARHHPTGNAVRHNLPA